MTRGQIIQLITNQDSTRGSYAQTPLFIAEIVVKELHSSGDSRERWKLEGEGVCHDPPFPLVRPPQGGSQLHSRDSKERRCAPWVCEVKVVGACGGLPTPVHMYPAGIRLPLPFRSAMRCWRRSLAT